MKKLMVVVATLTLLALTTAISPWAPMLALAAGATPSSQTIPNVTTTSGTVFVQTGWNRLTCSSDVYYLLVAAYSDTVTSATGTLLRGPQASNGLPKPAWILVSSNQWLALLLRSGTQATCVVETVSLDGSAGSFTTLAVSSTAAITGNTTVGGTLGVTGASTLTGNVTMSGAATVGTTLGVTGATTLSSTLGVTGITTLSAYAIGQDAGFHNMVTSGTSTNAGDNITGGGTKTRGKITLNGASPSVITATVNTGAFCVCSNEDTATNTVKCAVSATTLTVTGPNGATDDVIYHCIQ